MQASAIHRRCAALALLAFGAVAVFAPTVADARASVTIYADIAPPPLRAERMPPPRHGYVWVPGHWGWAHQRYVWHRGSWIPARHGYRYEPPRWERDGHRWRYRDGRWGR